MKIFSIVMLILLTSCNALVKHENDFKVISHDVMDEEIDEIIKPQIKENKK